MKIKFLLLASFLSLFLVNSAETCGPQRKPTLYILSMSVNVNCFDGECNLIETSEEFSHETNYLVDTIIGRCKNSYSRIVSHRLMGEKCTIKNCLKALEQIEDSDQVIVYIGAHGSWTKEDGYRSYFLGGDVSGRQIKERLSRLKGNVFVIVDTCHASGLISDWEKLTCCAGIPKNISILTASDENSCSYSWGMTSVLLEGLGHADFDKNGCISIKEVSDFTIYNLESRYPIQHGVFHLGTDKDLFRYRPVGPISIN